MAIKLEIVSKEYHLVLNQLTGKKTIAECKNLFYFPDPEFDKNLGYVGVYTPKRTIKVVDVTLSEGDSIANIFELFSGFWSKKWLSESQVTKVCKHFSNWFVVDQPILFLCKKNEFSDIDEDDPWSNLRVVEVVVDHENDFRIRNIPLNIVLMGKIRESSFRIIIPTYRKSKN